MSTRLGVFTVGSLQLALSLDVLREVVPCENLVDFPCAVPAVIGSISLRGAVLPVLDIMQAFGRPAHPRQTNATIVVMTRHRRMIGILADEMAGIFDCAVERMSDFACSGERAILRGAFFRPDTGQSVGVLCADVLSSIEGLPMLTDPEPERLNAGDSAEQAQTEGADGPVELEAAAAANGLAHLMLMRCAHLHLAISSAVVYATILSPEIKPSRLARDYFVGSVSMSGQDILAVDLMRFLGLGKIAQRDGVCQAFVVRYPEGLLAFVVEDIIDVVRADLAQRITLPPGALPMPAFFAGLLEAAAISDYSNAQVHRKVPYYFLIDAQRIAGMEQLASMARINSEMEQVQGDGAGKGRNAGVGGTSSAGSHCQVLSYVLGGEVVTPIVQISEILPWQADPAALNVPGPGAGLIVSRGRAIPVYRLNRLLDIADESPSAESGILVVEDERGCVGFAVPRLLTIDEAHSRAEGALTAAGVRRPQGGTPPGLVSVMVGSGSGERLVTLLDLHTLATQTLASASRCV